VYRRGRKQKDNTYCNERQKDLNTPTNVATSHVFPKIRLKANNIDAMKNVVFWHIKTQLVLHRGHITSPLQSPAG
jgi:hypothetical protein